MKEEFEKQLIMKKERNLDKFGYDIELKYIEKDTDRKA